MDGGRRLLLSVGGKSGVFAPARLAYANASNAAPRFSGLNLGGKGLVPRARNLRKRRASAPRLLLACLAAPGMGLCYAAVFFAAVGAYGVSRGGEYQAFIAAHGDPADIAAKLFGFGIKAVTIAGQRELTEREILGQAQISPRNSLFFLDVAQVRDNLKNVPLVKDVSVTKLYPDRLLIEIEERQPFALWQKNGQVHLVAEDGTALDSLRDDRFIHLPLVVGTGANEHLAEYLGLIERVGDLRERIAAGIFVAERRWTLKLTNGVDILLPETEPSAALVALNQLQRESRVLDKDILALDFRTPGRMIVRLSEEAAATRAESLAHKSKQKGGQT
jgi:cell division protein FtsQ